MSDPRDNLRQIYQDTKNNIKKIKSKEKLIQAIEYFYTLIESRGLENFQEQKGQMNFSDLEDMLDKLTREVSNRDFLNWVMKGKEPDLAQKYNQEIIRLNG